MTNILATYYKGISRQLRGEVDFINALFQHQGIKGAGNEGVLRDLIQRFIPKRYGVGTGVVIDRLGNQSRQCDIVIYDTLVYPSLLSLATVHLFPVDIVYATIEVKTTLDSGSAAEAKENIASVKRLSMIEDKYMVIEPRNGGLAHVSYTPSPPKGIVFAYNSNAQQFETFKNWFVPSENYDAPLLPTLVGCLDQGLIMYLNISPAPGTQPRAFAIPVAVPKPDGTVDLKHRIFKDNFGNIVQLDSEDRKALESEDSMTFEGEDYPLTTVNGNQLLIDQSRVFLLFILHLNEMLALMTINPQIRFSEHYLSNVERMRVEV